MHWAACMWIYGSSWNGSIGLLSETIFAQVDEMWVKYGLIDICHNVDHWIVHILVFRLKWPYCYINYGNVIINLHCDALQQQLWWQGKGPAVVLSKSTAIASITFLFIAIVQLLAEACSCWIECACHSAVIYARKCLWEMCTAKVNSSRGRFWMGAHSFPPLTWIVEHNNRQWISTIDCNNKIEEMVCLSLPGASNLNGVVVRYYLPLLVLHK